MAELGHGEEGKRETVNTWSQEPLKGKFRVPGVKPFARDHAGSHQGRHPTHKPSTRKAKKLLAIKTGNLEQDQHLSDTERAEPVISWHLSHLGPMAVQVTATVTAVA